MKCLVCVFVILTITACDIESAIDNASERCEDEIAKIIQSIESSCLTKDELFAIIDSVRARNDHNDNCVDGNGNRE